MNHLFKSIMLGLQCLHGCFCVFAALILYVYYVKKMFIKRKQKTYIGVTGGAAKSRWTVAHKHVEAIQTGSAVLTGIRLTLVNLCLTPATQDKTVGRC